jgi:uncharacterized repeat protein (TIGR03803 family)
MCEKRLSLSANLLALALFSTLPVIAARPAWAQTETVLYNFTGSPDGAVPESQLISDGAGNFFGTTLYGGEKDLGTVFELSPNGVGGWNETVLHSFTGGTDGEYPELSPLMFDSAGNLYGTTYYGGSFGCGYGCGVVYELTPKGKRWKESVLYSFTGGADGGGPVGGLIMDAAGNLYGLLGQAGGVFELSPSGGGWAEQLIYAADTRSGGLVMDAAGNMFGITTSTVFELSPNGNGGWIASVIHTFAGGPDDGSDPQGSLAFDRAGISLYGSTYSGGVKNFGTVYMLRFRPKGKYQGTWTERILHSFKGYPNDGSGPEEGITSDAPGLIWGTTENGGLYNYGTAFGVFGVSDGWGIRYREVPLWNFDGADGAYPSGAPFLDSAGNLYGTTPAGGSSGLGVVFEVNPNQ